MGCWWDVNGTVKPKKEKMEEAAAVIKKYDCDFGNGIEEGTFDLSFYDERGYGFVDDLVEELSPLLLEGEIDAHNDDDDAYDRYKCSNGGYTFCAGDKFIYFPGYEDDFAEQMPDKIVQAILKKYAKVPDSKKKSGV